MLKSRTRATVGFRRTDSQAREGCGHAGRGSMASPRDAKTPLRELFFFVLGFVIVLHLAPAIQAQNPVVNGAVQGQLGGREPLGVYPPEAYYQALEIYRDGDLARAIDAFDFALGRTRRDIQGRWLDAIPVLAMLGEAHWHSGNLEASSQAVEQAMSIAVRYRGWLSQALWAELARPGTREVNPSFLWPEAMAVNRLPLADKMKFRSGRVLTEQELVKGGAFEELNIKTLDVVEVMRGLAIACFRRRVILGPLLDNDSLAAAVLDSSRYPVRLSKGTVPYSLIGSLRAAEKLAAFQDADAMKDALANRAMPGGVHPLSAVTGLCQTYIAAGSKTPQAAIPIALTVANQAAAYQHYSLIGEALQIAAGCASEKEAALVQNAAVKVATSLVRRSRLATLHCLIVAADASVTVGQLDVAATHLGQARSLLSRRDVFQPRLAAYGAYVTARLAAVQNSMSITPGFRDSLSEPLAQMNNFAFNHRIRNRPMISMPRLFQIARVRAALGRSVSGQTSDKILAAYAAQPPIELWRRDPVDAIAGQTADREALKLARLNIAANRTAGDEMLVLQDDLLSGRLLRELELGGRLLQIRSLVRADDANLGKELVALRNKAPKAFKELRGAVAKPAPVAGPALVTYTDQLEAKTWSVGLDRTEIPPLMPPRLDTKSPSAKIPAHVAVMTFYQDGNRIHVTFASDTKTTYWAINNGATRINSEVFRMLRAIGVGKTRGDRLPKDEAWRENAGKLAQQLIPDPSLVDPQKLKDLVIVPDGPLWYLPFEMLPISHDSGTMLGDVVKVTYAATPGLALYPTSVPTDKTAVAMAAGKFFAPRDAEINTAMIDSVQSAAVNGDTVLLGENNLVPTAWMGANAGHVVVADATIPNLELPIATAPAPYEAGMPGGSLKGWLQFPSQVPQSLLLAGFRTPPGSGKTGTGRELFMTIAALQCAGVQDVLLSRWIVGGESTALALREYVQEAAFLGPKESWRRAREILKRTELDPAAEPTLMKSEHDREGLSGNEPFFWAGYLFASPLTADELAREPPVK